VALRWVWGEADAPPSNPSWLLKDGARKQVSGLVAEDFARQTGQTTWLRRLTAIAGEV
jgi:hypothetical protein